ncbi:MAG: metallophosphoesterase family protein [Verrucomicrobiota bacterium]
MKLAVSFWMCALALTGAGGIESHATEVVRGPYLQSATPNGVTIRWRTDVPVESVIHYGLQTNDLSFSASQQTPTNEHILSLSGLTPATTYYYAIGSATQALAVGLDYKFVTPPPSGDGGSTRVWVIGDSGGFLYADGNGRPAEVRDAYYQHAGARTTDVWLLLGDNAYDNGSDAEYQTNFFNVYPSLLRQTAPWPTIGNHDTYSILPNQSFPYLNLFSLPTNGEAGGAASANPRYYSFDHGNIHFICLDSTTQSRATNGAMANWLRADLAVTTNQWIIAFWHHAPYSKGTHNSDFSSEIEMIEMRENFLPILEAGKVDLVLGGHSHNYERSYLLHGHYGYSTELKPEMILDQGSGRENDTGAYIKATSGPFANRGTVYLVAGNASHIEPGYGRHPAMFTNELQIGSVVLEINSNRLDAMFLRETGAIDDHFTIMKRIRSHYTSVPSSFKTARPLFAGNPSAERATKYNAQQTGYTQTGSPPAK